jgi:shikimate kinase
VERDERNIYLIGPMGSGKTAVGRQLAKELGREFVDSDSEIEKRTGVDIPYIFEREGEAGFRARECSVLAELTARAGIVVATGGGAILDAATRAGLHRTGVVIYLKTDIDEQLKRTGYTHKRPLLQAEDPRGVLESLMAVRRPLYESLADLSIDTTGLKVRSVAARLRKQLSARRISALQKPTGPENLRSRGND